MLLWASESTPLRYGENSHQSAALAVLGNTPPDNAEATTLELLKNRNDSISAAAAAAVDRRKAKR